MVLHTWHVTITGHLIIHSCLEQMQLELGISGNILALDYYKYQSLILTESWVEHIWQFLTDHDIHLDLEIEELQLQRPHDRVLMEAIISSKV